MELLRLVVQAGGSAREVALGAAQALSPVAGNPAALLTGCRRLVARRPGSGPLVWLAARALCAPNPAEALRQSEALLRADPTPDRIGASLPAGSMVVVAQGVPYPGSDQKAGPSGGGGRGGCCSSRRSSTGRSDSLGAGRVAGSYGDGGTVAAGLRLGGRGLGSRRPGCGPARTDVVAGRGRPATRPVGRVRSRPTRLGVGRSGARGDGSGDSRLGRRAVRLPGGGRTLRRDGMTGPEPLPGVVWEWGGTHLRDLPSSWSQ